MTLLAIRINVANGEFDEDGEFDGDILDGEEEIFFIQTDEFASMENGISDVKDSLDTWSKYHA